MKRLNSLKWYSLLKIIFLPNWTKNQRRNRGLFKEADFISNSTAIVQATFDEYVEYVYNKITLYTVDDTIETTCDAYGIEAYATYEKGTLLNKIKLSSDAGVYRIAKNTRNIYFKIPLLISNEADTNKIYLCLKGLKVNVSTKDIMIIW